MCPARPAGGGGGAAAHQGRVGLVAEVRRVRPRLHVVRDGIGDAHVVRRDDLRAVRPVDLRRRAADRRPSASASATRGADALRAWLWVLNSGVCARVCALMCHVSWGRRERQRADLEAVIVLRVVRGGDHDTCLSVSIGGRQVGQGARHAPATALVRVTPKGTMGVQVMSSITTRTAEQAHGRAHACESDASC